MSSSLMRPTMAPKLSPTLLDNLSKMEGMQIDPSWQLALALILLVIVAVVISKIAKLGVERQATVAALRAVLQLMLVSGIVVLAVQTWWGAILALFVMFGIAVYTTTKRVETRSDWVWSALAMACGLLPVLAIIFLTGTAPFNGMAILPIGSIMIGNMMTAHTLNGQQTFGALRNGIAQYEAALALGFERPKAMQIVIEPIRSKALQPNLDSTKTVGLVTLPGAFIGVLLGGGTPLQAGAAQLLVLIGIMAGQVITVAVAQWCTSQGRLLPNDLRERLHP